MLLLFAFSSYFRTIVFDRVGAKEGRKRRSKTEGDKGAT